MYDEYESEFQSSEFTGDGGHDSIDEISWQSTEEFAAAGEDRCERNLHQLRAFLVACHQAAVSIETMSRQLGFDTETIRTELILGLEAWTAAQRRPGEALPAKDLGRVDRRD